MMHTKVLILLALIFGTAHAEISWKDLQANIDSWSQGPASLILTDQEQSIFKKLKTPEEKLQFIRIFWARRDPILRTRVNEFKQEFYDRVSYTNEKFGEAKTEGWKTARGQVYILFGPPSREEQRLLPDSSRPALLWVYDKRPSKELPANEALLFLYHDTKYVLAPPNPDPGDVWGARQREFDKAFRYQTIPSSVREAFSDVAHTNIVDEKKNYDPLLYSVKSSEKFGITELNFDIRISQSDPPQIQVSIPVESAPVYDDGRKTFAEFLCTLELRKAGTVVASKKHSTSLNWEQSDWEQLKEVVIPLPTLDAPSGEYELWITVQDSISAVAETRKTSITYR